MNTRNRVNVIAALDDGKMVNATAFFASIEFDELWRRRPVATK
jgi:hypothetical protein